MDDPQDTTPQLEASAPNLPAPITITDVYLAAVLAELRELNQYNARTARAIEAQNKLITAQNKEITEQTKLLRALGKK